MILIQTSKFAIKTINRNDFPAILKIYKQSEDFLSLGPVSSASMEMVLKDIKHSKETKGKYCGICDLKGDLVGIIAFIPLLKDKNSSFLSLIMIASSHRCKGLGSKVVHELERYLQNKYLVKRILSAVQTNNKNAILFWKKCGYTIILKPEKRPDKTTVYHMEKELAKQ